jgi:integrase
MARPSTGTVEHRVLTDGTRAFHLRFRAQGKRELVVLHEQPGCGCGCGGGWTEPAARTELGNIHARLRAGVWERPAPPPTLAERPSEPTFHEYASWWLRAKIDGVLGAKPISPSTAADYRWRLRCHLLPFFGHHRLNEIDSDLCQQFKARKLREAAEQREAIAAGADLRDERGRRIFPLGPASLRKLIDGLAAILDDAIEDGHIDHNPARGKRMRVHVPKPKRTFLEMDELACLLDAAAAQDRPLGPTATPAKLGPTAALVAHLLSQGTQPKQIAKELGLAKSTVSFHMRRLGANVGRGYIGRRIVVEILGRSGVRASELCDLRIGQVRLHDPDGTRFRIPDSKTETGIREVQMSPDLVEAAIEHIDRLRRIGAPTGPEDYLVPNLNGTRLSRQRVAEIVSEAAKQTSEYLTAKGLPPLPHTTPHSLRRTYISIALLANNFDVKWVMSQVGHADSKMTLDVYAQLEQRVDRSHGTSFDRLVRKAREQVAGISLDIGHEIGPISAGLGDEKATRPKTRPTRPIRRRPTPPQKPPRSREKAKWRDPDSNWGHHDFQSCALPTELSRRWPTTGFPGGAVDRSDAIDSRGLPATPRARTLRRALYRSAANPRSAPPSPASRAGARRGSCRDSCA